MRMAIDAVANGEAEGVVSAGNTGALLALAKIVLKSLPGIDRPAMAAIGPSARGDVVMLDLGANVACDTRNLVEFAVMGDVFARTVLGLTSPTIGLLNVGSEEMKGDDRLRAGRRHAARQPSGAAIPWLRRRPRHRRRHHRRDRHRRVHRQRGAENRRRRAEADRRSAAPGVQQHLGIADRLSAGQARSRPDEANGSTRAATTAP